VILDGRTGFNGQNSLIEEGALQLKPLENDFSGWSLDIELFSSLCQSYTIF